MLDGVVGTLASGLLSVPNNENEAHTATPGNNNRNEFHLSLETLPAEVRHSILCTLELSELKALILASPVYHQQYLFGRRAVLCSSLELSLCGSVADACAVHRSGLTGSAAMNSNEKVAEFLSSYRQGQISTKHLTEDEAVQVAIFFSTTMRPLLEIYSNSALQMLDKEVGETRMHAPTTRTEKARFIRAMYRFQLCCNLFGRGSHGSAWQQGLGFRSNIILEKFISIFEPWEVEEIACVYTFAKMKYEQTFLEVQKGMHRDNAAASDRGGGGRAGVEGAFGISSSCMISRPLKHNYQHNNRMTNMSYPAFHRV
jgi:hypothetical protein